MGICGSKGNVYMTAAVEPGDIHESKEDLHPNDTRKQAKLRAIFNQQLQPSPDESGVMKVQTAKLEELLNNNESMYDQLTQESDFRISFWMYLHRGKSFSVEEFFEVFEPKKKPKPVERQKRDLPPPDVKQTRTPPEPADQKEAPPEQPPAQAQPQ